MKVFVISGPSGSGKSSIVSKLMNVKRSKSYTTRQPRDENDNEYVFVSKEKFNYMVFNNMFVEYQKVYDNYYGALHPQDDNTLYVIEYKGKQALEAAKHKVISIAILPPSLDILKERLFARGDYHDNEIRYNQALNEIDAIRYYDYIVVNDNLNDAIIKVQSIINKHA